MRVAFLSFYSGKVNRGVETYVQELSSRLTLLGHKVDVFEGGKSKARNVKDFTIEVLSKVSADTDVLIPTNGGWQSLLSKIWCVRHGKKLIISGQAGPGFDDRLNLWVFPDCFVGLTDYQCTWAREASPFVKVAKIPNGVDLKKFKSGGGMKLNLPRPTILSVGAFVSMKRLDLAIKGVSKLSKGSLLLVGKGELEKSLKELGDRLLPGRFQALSFAHTEMPGVYRAADLFTFPTSPWESFGIVLLEAMACGLPVVVSDDPIRREIVGDAGLFADPENTDGYAKALKTALETKWGNKPRQQAEKFSWDKIAQQYDMLFRSLIK